MASDGFTIKDSGERLAFAGGMVRDTAEGKPSFLSTRFGPMYRRWADHLMKGRAKYPDVEPGTPNWTLAKGVEEYLRAKESFARHAEAWLRGERDEDHAAAMFFNINVAEYVLERDPTIDPGLGAALKAAAPQSIAAPPALLARGWQYTGEYREPRSGEPFRCWDSPQKCTGFVSPKGGARRWILERSG